MARTRWLRGEEVRAWRGYRRMRTVLDLQLGRDLARDSDLSESDYDVLSTITEVDERRWRARALANQLLWSTSRLAHQVRRMEERGLVRREECLEDGRGAVISLTAKGQRVLEAAAPHHVESVRRHFIDVLTEEELRLLGDISAKVAKGS